nr:DDE-type integrase/transposase/recombinase [Gordonia paraffinivorans]
MGIHRSTMRLHPAPITAEEAEPRSWLRGFSTDRPRWGWRRAAIAARKAGFTVNNKRIRRLWREEGLRVPQRRRKKRLTGIGTAVGAMCPIRPNAIWAMDFQFDTTADGRTIKMLNVIDEFTREALAIHVDRVINADGVVDVLDRLALIHGPPCYVRFDNGPEFRRSRRQRLVPIQRHRITIHRPRLPMAERLDRIVQRPPARRAAQLLAL